jgi:hypothetical protein
LLLSNLDSAVDGGTEGAARAGFAEARHESDVAVEKDEEERRRPTAAFSRSGGPSTGVDVAPRPSPDAPEELLHPGKGATERRRSSSL